MKQLQIDIESYLETLYDEGHVLRKAMRYSLMAGGKRFRPMLVLLVGQDLGISKDVLLPIAASIEMIHTYSLIHDDLPALDNDDLRRGKPTNHRVFGEATAILAGDGLLTDAFLELSKADVSAQAKVDMIALLASCAGSRGMIQGQSDDLQFEQQRSTLQASEAYPILKQIHANKTGKLIEACFMLPTYATELSHEKRTALQDVSRQLGLWFQIRDDILDVSATTEELGKDAGSDILNDKLTYVSLFGLDGANEKRNQCEMIIHRLFIDKLSDMPHIYAYIKKAMK